MEDPTTVALNLTFFGTLGVAFVMFLGLFTVFVLTLVLAGLGRGAALVVRALAGFLGSARSGPGTEPAPLPRPAATAGPRLPAAQADPAARADPGSRLHSRAQAPSAPEAPEQRKAG